MSFIIVLEHFETLRGKYKLFTLVEKISSWDEIMKNPTVHIKKYVFYIKYI